MIRPSSKRAGQYVRQLEGYSAFIPAPLPPDPPIEVSFTGQLLRVLSDADRSLGRLDGVTSRLPNPDLFVSMYVRKEAVLSSQIEGTEASLLDVLEFEDRMKEARDPDDVREVLNYVGAMNHGLARLESLPVSLRLIREIHGKLLSGVRGSERAPGEFRRSQNWIGPAGCPLRDARFVPPPPGEMMRALSDFESFLHAEDHLPVLIKIGLAHAQFETIHPFLDGNGRVGRLLITFLLCERKILTRPLLYLSFYFKVHRTEYYDRLQTVRDSGDWESWLVFFLKGIREVSEEACSTARRILTLRDEHRELVGFRFKKHSGAPMTLLEQLFDRPILSVEGIARVTHLTFSSANKMVRRLEELGILQEITGQRRNRRFAYRDYLDLFADPETGSAGPPETRRSPSSDGRSG